MNIDKLIKIAEDEGWKVSQDFQGGQFPLCLEFENYSEKGQDIIVSATLKNDDCEELLEQVRNYYDNYDVSYESIIWADKDGHGRRGAPNYLGDIVKDMEQAKVVIGDLYQSMLDLPYRNRKSKKAFKDFFKIVKLELLDWDNKTTPETIKFLKNYWLSENYYGEDGAYITFGSKKIDIESVWHDEENVWIHVNCEAFETDIKVIDLSDKNIKRVAYLLYHKYFNNLKEGLYD